MTTIRPPNDAPLDPEERALAQRLARLGPRGEPSPALDARILAAAHAALDTTAGPQRRRWPLALGVAASLALAVGIAWQLRPLPAALPVYDEDAAAMRAAQPAAAAVGTEAGEQRRDREAAAAPIAAPASAAASPTDAATEDPVRSATPPPAPREPLRSLAPPRPVPAPPPPPPAPVVFDEPSPIDTYAPPAPPAPPPPPPVEPAAVPRAFPPAADATATTQQATDAPAPPRTFAPAAQAERQRQARAEADRASEIHAAEVQAAQARTARAAATARIDGDNAGFADTAQGRRDWLQHVRDLRDAGRLDDARTALRAFRARHPDYPLADDLQALAQ